MKGVWITAAIIALNWAVALVMSEPNASVPPDHSSQWIWSGYAAVAAAVTGLVASHRAPEAFWLAVPLVVFSVFSPWLLGLVMLPASLAALVLATKASRSARRAPAGQISSR